MSIVTIISSIPHLPLTEQDWEMGRWGGKAKMKDLEAKYPQLLTKSALLNNATVEGKFTNDRRIKEYQLKSIPYTPLIDQGQLSGSVPN